MSGIGLAGGDTDGDGFVDLVAAPERGHPSHLRVLSGRDGSERLAFFPYGPGFAGGVSVAVGDVTGDGADDIVTGAAAGAGPHVKVFDGRTGAEVRSFLAFDEAFRGGVHVAAGDTNRDGRADIVVGAGTGGSGHLKVFDGADGAELHSFLASGAGGAGAVSVAAGDVDADGAADVIVGAGAGGSPLVRAFSGTNGTVLRSFLAFAPGFTGGVRVAAADVTGDRVADVVVGAAAAAPHVIVFDGRTGQTVYSFLAFEGFEGGVDVAAADLDGDGQADLMAGAGSGGNGHVRAFAGAGLTDLRSFHAYRSTGAVRAGTGAISLPLGGTLRHVSRETNYSNETGLYATDDAEGTVGGLRPGDAGYAAAALARRIVVGPEAATVPLAPGHYGAYIVQSGTYGRWAAENPANRAGGPLTFFSFAAANPDGFDHFRALGAGNFGFEDLTGGGDQDFNDTVLAITRVVTDPVEWAPGVQTGGSVETPTDTDPDGPPVPGNTPPTISALVDRTTTWNVAVGPLPFTVGDLETPAADLAVAVAVSDPALLAAGGAVLGGSGANRTLTLTPAPGAAGNGVVTVTVTDAGGRTASTSFRLTVTAPALFPELPFAPDLTGWTVAERGGSAGTRGTVAAPAGAAVLREGDSFVTTLSRAFTVPAGSGSFAFTFSALGFDTSAPGFVNDAFEAALLDAAGNPLVPTFALGRDAFLNVTDGGAVATGAGVSVAGQRVTVDLSAVPAGTAATLVFRLVNNDADTGSSVTVGSYALPAAGAEAAVKFFVADAAADRSFRYGAEGLTSGAFDLSGVADPSGAASNPAGDKVWVVDAPSHEVSVFGPSGALLGRWTAADVTDPQGVTVAGGDLWLVDRGTSTVRRYVGGALRMSGSASAGGSFALAAANTSPSDLVTDGATVWVTDDASAGVFVYDVSGAPLGRWQLDGDNTAPSGITIDPSGGTDLWVVDRGTATVFQYAGGRNVRTGAATAAGTFGLAPTNIQPEGLADPPPPRAELFVSSYLTNQVLRYDGDTGAFLGVFAQGNGLDRPDGLTFGPDGHLYAASANGYVYRFDGGTGAFLDRFASSNGITQSQRFGPDGRLYVTSFLDRNIRRFDGQTGALLGTFAVANSLENCVGLTFGPDGNLYVAGGNSRNVARFDGTTGAYLGDFVPRGSGGLAFAEDVAFGPDGNLYVTSESTNQVLRYDGRTGAFIDVFASGGLEGAQGLTFGPDGDLFVNSRAGDRVLRYDGSTGALLGTFTSGRPLDYPPGGIVFRTNFELSPPTISATTTAVNGEAAAGAPVLISGVATAFGPAPSIPNRIVSVTVNGIPAEALDDAGNFFAPADVLPGRNVYRIVATDLYGQEVSVDLTVRGVSTVGPIGQRFSDVTGSFRAEYARTSFEEGTKTLFADVAVRNTGNYPAGAPLYVAVKNISDPAVRVLTPSGTLADGTPYYDATGLVPGGTLAPGAATGTLGLAFANPNRGRFTYDLVFLGVPNRAPAFTTIPKLEATVGREYRYAAAGTDPDGDPLAFSLVSGPTGTTVNETTGVVAWTPTAAQVGAFAVTLRLSDGRGGTDEQTFTLVSAVGRPNRPPVFITTPGGEAQAGQVYTYDADATDPDRDALTYSLAAGFPAGMSVNATTGVITWTPTFAQLVDTDVTVVADDGRGGIVRQSYTICVGNDANRPPVIVSTPVTNVPSNSGRVVAVGDDWTLSDAGFGSDTERFALNVARYLTGSGTGKLLGYSTDFGLTGSRLASAFSAAGYEWTVSTSVPFTLEALAGYDAVFLGGFPADNEVLIEYLRSGRGVYVYAGTGGLGDTPPGQVGAGMWQQFLHTVGLEYETARYDGREGFFPIHSSHPIFDGVSALYQKNASVVRVFEATGSTGKVLVPVPEGGGLYAVAENDLYRYDVKALDPDGGPLTYSLTQATTGMTINPITGVISWAPPQDAANQSFPVTVRADDGRGGFDEQKFTVTVKGFTPTAREFDPVVEWHKGTFAVRPGSNQVMMTPAVIDLNADGTPDIVFSTFGDQGVGGGSGPGVLRAVSGRDGSDIWTATDPAYAVDGYSGIAVGDVDRDGRPEIFATDPSQTRVLAFRSDGSGWWISPQIPGSIVWGSGALADLDGDGTPEIVIGATVLNSAGGSIRWSGTGGRGNNGAGPLSAVADLDLDGSPEVLAGNTAYRSDGSVYWSAGFGDGFTAIGNFNADPFPEIVLVSGGAVSLLTHDGAQIWGPVALPGGGGGGAPTVADFDNDGRPEIGVAGAAAYTVFETDGSVRWSAVTQDYSSTVTGSSVFDFDGDGQAEVVYGDEVYLRIYRGTDGTELYRLPKSSATTYELPVIADVDGDGNAEILAVASSGQNGLYVIGDRNNTWVNARQIWNQHTYHITNINDDGTIPAHEANSWQTYNTYRLNVLTDGVDPRATPNLVVSSVRRVGTGVPLAFTARIDNTGYAPVSAGVTVNFYDGDPAKRGTLVGTVQTANRLRSGEHEDVFVTLAVAAVNDLWVMVDPDNRVAEFDDDDNARRGVIDTDPMNYAPRLWREIAPAEASATANVAFRLPLPVSDPDGDAITYSVVSGPDGLMVHPTLGVVAWVPKRSEVGTHQVVVKATDAAGNVTLVPFAVAVVSPNTPPVFTSNPPTGPATVGHPFEYRVTAQDAETAQAELRYSLRAPLPGMSINATTGVFTWTPTAAQVGVQVNVVVSDGAATTEQTFALEVLATALNRSPSVSVLADGSAWLGRGFGAQVSATDADGDPVRFELVSGPQGMTVDAETGVVRWAPTATAAPVPVEVRVTDGRGGSESAIFTVSVFATDHNRAPRVVSNPPRTAVHGTAYSYDLKANDPDGDDVLWQLVSAPQGVSLDPGRGTLRWTPAEDQTGPQSVTVRVFDPLLAWAEQTFTIDVSCDNQGPSVVSRPPTEAYANDPYLYAVRATDPEGDALTFEVESGPSGMLFSPGTSLLRWTPTTAQAGPQTVVVRVTDAAGNVGRQSFAVVVSTEAPNRPPVITSRPLTGVTVGRTYAYTVAARDPDGDALAFTLRDEPEGMTISSAGVISWVPTAPGSHTVTVEVSDARGGRAVQSFALVARANQGPTVSPPSGAPPDAVVGATFRTQIRAADPEGDPLTFMLTRAPAGMTIDGQGRIAWPVTGAPRSETVLVTVTDPDGVSTTVSFTVRAVSDTAAPAVRLDLAQAQVNLGAVVRVTVSATDNVGVAALTLTANGIAVALDSQNRAYFPAAQAGRVTFTATATDASGNVGAGSADLIVVDPNLASDVRADITRLDVLTAPGVRQPIVVQPDTPVTVTYLTDVIGTVQTFGQPLAEWRVLLARGDQVDVTNVNPDAPYWTVIGSGTAAVVNGKLAVFDPTVLTNDRYVIAVVAYDVTGAGYVKPVEVDVVGNAKLGEFRLEFTDLAIPLNGIPVQITRVYDTREAGISGDFGYGWTLGVRDARIRETVPAGVSLVPDKSKVYLTAPDGTRVGFTYKERLDGGFTWGFGQIYTPYFVADPGVNYKLAMPGVGQIGRGGPFSGLGEGVNPDRYALTTPDGTVYEYDQFTGLQKITDTNGNTVTFSATAITHSGGRVIALDRDGQGRVTAIRLPDGNVAVRYRYDAKGDLVEVKQVTEVAPTEKSLVSSFVYQTDRPHYLDEYVDANGKRAVKTEYDAAGRVVATIDAAGHRQEKGYDLTAFTEMVRDAAGNAGKFVYDDRGNVVSVTDPLGATTALSYDANDNVVRIIDPRGNQTTREFDSRGYITRIVDTASGSVWTAKYNQFNTITSATDPLGRVLAYVYDSAGNLTGLTDPTGATTRYAYDPSGRLTAVTDPTGQVTALVYASGPKPVEIRNADGTKTNFEYTVFGAPAWKTDERGNKTAFSYDAAGRLKEITDASGGVATLTYLGDQIVALTDPLGRRTTYDYNALGYLSRTTDPAGASTVYTHDTANRVATVTDPTGITTRYTYLADGRLGSVRLGTSVTAYEYDPAGNLAAEIDPNGHRTAFRYDSQNRLIERTSPVGGVSKFTYDAVGNLLAATDENGHVTTYEYDAADRVRRLTDAAGGVQAWEYDSRGLVRMYTDQNGHATHSTYDARQRLVGATDAAGGVTAYAYDLVGNLSAITDALQRVTQFGYDALNRQTSSTDPTESVLTYRHDAAGQLQQTTDPLGFATNYFYDAAGRLRSVTDAEGAVSQFAYDAAGRLTATTNATGERTTRTYDDQGRLSTVTDAGGFTSRYAYDPAGNLVAFTDPLGNATAFAYDAADRLTTESDPLGMSRSFAYDPVGNLVEAEDRNGRVRQFAYDALDRRTSEAWLVGSTTQRTLVWTYDAVGNLLTATDPDASYTYSYDTLNRLKTVNTAGSTGFPAVVLNYTYDAVGNLLSVQDSAGVQVASLYDEADRLVSRTWSGAGISARFDLAYNTRGERASVSRFSDAAGAQLVASTQFTYDEVGRITGLTHQATVATIVADYRYTYDSVGRLTTESHHGETTQYGYDATGQLVQADRSARPDESFVYDANGNRTGSTQVGLGNRLTSDDKFTYRYDNEGNLVEKTARADGQTWRYSYDHRNRLTAVEISTAAGGTLRQVEFKYDLFDRRIVTIIDGARTNIVYDGEHAWADYDAAGNVISRYLIGSRTDEVIARHRPGEGVAWYLADRLGTVHDVVNSAGQVIDHVVYDAFGAVTVETNPAAGDRFKFTGREYDVATGLYYYRARYFDPATGRFISPDPIGLGAGDGNLYRYINNGPVNGTDPSGQIALFEYTVLRAGVIGAVSGALINLVAYGIDNRDNLTWQGAGEAIVTGGLLGAFLGASAVISPEFFWAYTITTIPDIYSWVSQPDEAGFVVARAALVIGSLFIPIVAHRFKTNVPLERQLGSGFGGGGSGGRGGAGSSSGSGTGGGRSGGPGTGTSGGGQSGSGGGQAGSGGGRPGGGRGPGTGEPGRPGTSNPGGGSTGNGGSGPGAGRGAPGGNAEGPGSGGVPRPGNGSNQPRIDPGRQGKHIPGHNNFVPGKGRSELTHPNPQELLNRGAGTGTPLPGPPRGTPGYREVVDFHEVIGDYFKNGVRVGPTTRGTIHYGGEGTHIVPASPEPPTS